MNINSNINIEKIKSIEKSIKYQDILSKYKIPIKKQLIKSEPFVKPVKFENPIPEISITDH